MTTRDAVDMLIRVVVVLVVLDAILHALGVRSLSAQLLLAVVIGAAFGGLMRTVEWSRARRRRRSGV